ncbi:MAG: response regulator [Myxococcota bacterium]
MSESGTDVLIIDDEQAYRESIGTTLRGQGLEVQLASSMEQARDRARVSPPALVLLDLRMPGSDSLAHLEEWLGMAAPPRVIVLSEATAQEQVLEALRRGATDYLAKPVHEEELCLAVRRGARQLGPQRRSAETGSRG